MKLRQKIDWDIYRKINEKRIRVRNGGRDSKILFRLVVFLPLCLGSAIALIRWLFMGERLFLAFNLLLAIALFIRHGIPRIYESFLRARYRADRCDPMHVAFGRHSCEIRNDGKLARISADPKRLDPVVRVRIRKKTGGRWVEYTNYPKKGARIIDFDDGRARKGANRKKKTGAGSRRMK